MKKNYCKTSLHVITILSIYIYIQYILFNFIVRTFFMLMFCCLYDLRTNPKSPFFCLQVSNHAEMSCFSLLKLSNDAYLILIVLLSSQQYGNILALSSLISLFLASYPPIMGGSISGAYLLENESSPS